MADLIDITQQKTPESEDVAARLSALLRSSPTLVWTCWICPSEQPGKLRLALRHSPPPFGIHAGLRLELEVHGTPDVIIAKVQRWLREADVLGPTDH